MLGRCAGRCAGPLFGRVAFGLVWSGVCERDLEHERRRVLGSYRVADVGRQDLDLMRAQGVRAAVDCDDDLAFDGLNGDGSGGLVVGEARAGVEGEEGDGSSAELEERLLAMAVLGGAFATECREFGGEIEDVCRGLETRLGIRAKAVVAHGDLALVRIPMGRAAVRAMVHE